MRHDRSWRLGRRGAVTMLLAALVLATLGAVAYAAVRPARTTPRPGASRVRPRQIRNSHGGDALVGMHGMLPGDSTTGDGAHRQREQGARRASTSACRD